MEGCGRPLDASAAGSWFRHAALKSDDFRHALLFAFMWMWWQYDRDAMIDEVGRCVQRTVLENPGDSPHLAVWACYRDQ